MVHSPFQPGDPRTPNNPFYARIGHTPRLRRTDRNMRFFRQGLFSGFESEFDSPIDGVSAAMILDFSGVVGGQYWNGVSNTLKFADLVDYTIGSLATQKESDGFIKYAPHNLALQSNTFTTTWAQANLDLTGTKIIGPDGIADSGWLFLDDNGDPGGPQANVGVTQGFTVGKSTNYTLSVYAKQAQLHWLALRTSGFTTPANQVNAFDLLNGVTGVVGSDFTSSIADAGDGWFKCSISFLTDDTDTFGTLQIFVSDDEGSASVPRNGTSSIYISSASFYQTPMAAANDTFDNTYVPTTTAIVYQQRLDHDEHGNRIGLLIEKARTNLCLQSADFTTVWGGSATITANDAIAPSGELEADKIADTSTGSSQNRSQVIAVPDDSAVYTASYYVLKDTVTTRFPENLIRFSLGSARDFRIRINTATGELDTSLANTPLDITIELHGLYWYITVTVDNNSTGNTQLSFFFQPAISSTIDGAADSTVIGDITVWGVQVELGAFPSSYIPTTTVPVTRASEVAIEAISKFDYSETEGTFAVKWQRGADPNNVGRVFDLADGTNNAARIMITVDGDANVGVDGRPSSTVIPINTLAISALAFATNDASQSTNGAAANTDTSVTLPTGEDTIYLGVRSDGATHWGNSHIEYLSYYAANLSDADIEALSTITDIERQEESGAQRIQEDNTIRLEE